MATKNQDSLWVAGFLGIFLSGIVGLFSYNQCTGLRAKLWEMEQNQSQCSQMFSTNHQLISSDLAEAHSVLSDLLSRTSVLEQSTLVLSQGSEEAQVELMLIQSALASAQESLAEERAERLRGQELYTKQSDAINRLAALLKPEDLRAKAQHYLLTQAKIITEHGSGSGTVLKDNFVLTAYHVVDHADGTVWAEIPHADGSTSKYATVLVKGSEEHDVALLKILGAPPLLYVTIKSKEECAALPLLSPVIVIGYPVGIGPYFTHGELVAKNVETNGYKDCWRVNSDMFFGNSGGGLFDAATGELIGMPVQLTEYRIPLSWVGVCTPMHRVLEWLEKK